MLLQAGVFRSSVFLWKPPLTGPEVEIDFDFDAKSFSGTFPSAFTEVCPNDFVEVCPETDTAFDLDVKSTTGTLVRAFPEPGDIDFDLDVESIAKELFVDICPDADTAFDFDDGATAEVLVRVALESNTDLAVKLTTLVFVEVGRFSFKVAVLECFVTAE